MPGLISWAGVTQKSAKVLKMTLDNGEEIICTPEHKFVSRENGFIKAQNFKVGDSLMPIYRKKQKIEKRTNEYEMVFDNEDKTWKYTHRVMANICKGIYSKPLYYSFESDYTPIIHHIDYNRFNNSPDNLCFMHPADHIKLHAECSSGKRLKMMKEKFPEQYKKFVEETSKKSKKYWGSLTQEQKQEHIEKARKGIKKHFKSLDENRRKEKAEISRKNFYKGTLSIMEKRKDSDYNNWYCERLSQSWTEEKRQNASERTKLLMEKRVQDVEYMNKFRQNHKEKQKVVFDKKHFNFIKELVKDKTTHQFTGNDVVNALNNNKEMLELFIEINKDKSVPNCDINEGITVTMLPNFAKQFGYQNWKKFRQECVVYNHKIMRP